MATRSRKDSTLSAGVVQDKPNSVAAEVGDHDRIVMASRRADGSLDQRNPVFIGDEEPGEK